MSVKIVLDEEHPCDAHEGRNAARRVLEATFDEDDSYGVRKLGREENGRLVLQMSYAGWPPPETVQHWCGSRALARPTCPWCFRAACGVWLTKRHRHLVKTYSFGMRWGVDNALQRAAAEALTTPWRRQTVRGAMYANGLPLPAEPPEDLR